MRFCVGLCSVLGGSTLQALEAREWHETNKICRETGNEQRGAGICPPQKLIHPHKRRQWKGSRDEADARLVHVEMLSRPHRPPK